MNDAPKPFLTVAIPVFNGEAVLAPMLASLDAQDWSLLEVRFGDDGSTDGTRGVLDAFAAKHPGRVFAESHENMGPGPTRNRLLAQAEGEYVWFCDADDEIAPGSIARISEILTDNPVDFLSLCYGEKSGDLTDARLELPPVPVSTFELLLSMPCATVAKVAKSSMLRDLEITFPTTNVGEDIVQALYAACNSKSALFWYAKPYFVRRLADSASGKVDDAFCENLKESITLAGDAAKAFPQFKMAIEVQLFDFWNYFLRRLRNDAPRDVREKWGPVVKSALCDFVLANDNPLLRIPRSFSRREREALKREREALKREREALKREQSALKQEDIAERKLTAATKRERAALRREQAATKREQAATKREQAALKRVADIQSSLSWRITRPLRTVVDFIARQKAKKGTA